MILPIAEQNAIGRHLAKLMGLVFLDIENLPATSENAGITALAENMMQRYCKYETTPLKNYSRNVGCARHLRCLRTASNNAKPLNLLP